MPTYKYVAVNLQKQKFKGKYIAEDEKDLSIKLAQQNLYLVSASEYKGGTPSAFFTLGTGKVGMPELTTFCRQFAIMHSTGVQVFDCLELLKKQPFTSYFKSILQVVSEDVKSGDMLSTALEKHKKVFPEFFISMVHVGEASGKLDTVFVSLADYYESDAAIKRKAKAALSYPLMLAGMAVVIIIMMLAFVVPTFEDVLMKLNVEPEGFTATVYSISHFLTDNWRILVLAVIFVGIAAFVFFRTETGKYTFDVFKIKCPVIKKLTVDLITARFARAFSILLSSGMDLATALDTTSMIIGNRYMQKKFREASDDVRQGVTLTDAFDRYKLFPEMLIQMLAVGEQTNSLDEVLSRSCRFFDEQVESSLSSVTSKIQPVMLIVIGGIIGALFLAVYTPMLSIMNQLA